MAADDFLRGPSETAGQVWEGVSRRFAQRFPVPTWRLREQMFRSRRHFHGQAPEL